MKQLIGLIETIFLFIFSYLIPKDKNLILFGSMKTKYIGGNPKIYYLYLRDRYGYKYNILFCDPNKTNTDSRIKTYGKGIKKYWMILRAKVLIIDCYCGKDLGTNGVIIGNYNSVQMWHGEPIKKIGLLSELYIDRLNSIVLFFEKLEYKTYKLILSNPGSIEFIKGCFQSENVDGIGVPRNDLLLHKDILNLIKNNKVEDQIVSWKEDFKKVILLAPTFRETDSSDYFSREEAEKLNNTLSKNNYLLIIKTHPNETRAFLNKEYSNIKNITESMNYDATDFTPFVDVVMTDYSSIYIDFLLTGKPVIFYQKDLDDYINRERGLLYKPEHVVIKNTSAYDFEELLSVISQFESMVGSNTYKKEYCNLYNLFFKGLDTTVSSCSLLDKKILTYKN